MPDLPTVTVEIAFDLGPESPTSFHLDSATYGLLDTGTLDAALAWTDVTDWLASLTTGRGSNRATEPVLTYEAGTATVVLVNNDGRFDPTNLTGPYVSAGRTQVEPGRRIRIRATWGSSSYDLFTGYIDSWGYRYDGPQHSYATLTATDGFKVLTAANRAPLATGVGGGELSGTRVTRILDSISWPTPDRDIDPGIATLQSTALGGTALEELQLVATTEAGDLYVNGSGKVVYRDRHAALFDPRSVISQAAFGSALAAGELPYTDIGLLYDETTLVNYARITAEGGTEQTANAVGDSQTRYGVHGYEKSGLLMQTDNDALAYAQYAVGSYAVPELRFTDLEIDPRANPDLMYPHALGREIGDRITVRRRPPWGGMIEQEVFIRGIGHEHSTGKWKTKWVLQSAATQDFFVLDSATLGVLDSSRLTF